MLLALLVLGSVVLPLLPQEDERVETYDEALARGVAALNSGLVDEGLTAFQKCLELRPRDPGASYNLACAFSRKGEIDPALDWLGKSIEWGWLSQFPGRLAWLGEDSDLDPLRADPRFQQLVEKAWRRMEAAEPPLPPAFIDWTEGHRTGVEEARFSPDGSRILSSCGDNCVRIWDATSGGLLVLIVGRGNGTHCAWADAGRQVLTGGLRFWDARTGDLLRLVPGPSLHKPPALSPDGRLILCPTSTGATLIDFQTGLRHSVTNGSATYGVALSPDGARFATASADGKTRLFDVGSRECLATHQGVTAVFDVTFSPDGRWVVTAGSDGLIRWLDPISLKLVRSSRAHPAEVNSLVFRPDGAELLTTSVDRTAKVWNAADGSLRLTLSGHADEVMWGGYRADGKRILTPSKDGTVRVWDTQSGDLILTLGGHGRLLSRTVAFSPSAALVSFDDRGVREWDDATGRELAPGGGYPSVRVKSARGGTPCEVTCRSWAAEVGAIEIEGARVGVDAVFFAPDRRVVYSADRDDRGRLWDAESGRILRELGPLSRDGNLTDFSSRWSSACFSPDRALLATAQHADGAVHLWESSSGEEVVAFPGGGKWAAAVAFDPSGEWLAVTRGDNDSSVDVWNVRSGERVSSLRAENWASDVEFRPDGQVLATGNLNGRVQLWNLESGEVLRVLRSLFPASVLSMAFTPDGKRLAAATVDHRLLLWDAESGNLLGTIVPGDEPGDWLAFAPSGHYHGTPASIARARLVQGAISYPLSCFAAALESPEQVQASFAGAEVPLPKLPAPPSLVVARPTERTSSTAERSAHVEALATEPLAGLAKIEVVQDGASVPEEVLGAALTLENNERLARLDLRLPMPAGANEMKITLQAVSTRGIKSRPESFVVRYEPPKRELYVLALGVADYADDTLDLAYPVEDVDGLLQRLQAQQGELFHAVHVERRADREVTPAEVLRLRDQFLLRAKPDDTIVVFVAGHGVRTDTGEYWLLTSEASPQRPYSGIKRADVESLVTWDKLHATKRVLLLDTCHSGAAFGKGARGERGIAFQQSEVDTLLERSSGLYILAATSDDGFAREQEGNGLFTRALLDGLDGAADAGDFGDKDGTVGIDELMHFARYAVLERSLGRQQPTFPRIEGGENFPLARARAAEGAGR